MGELLEKDQVISIVPQNFRNSNKGKIKELHDDRFVLEVFHNPTGILINNLIEFYSKTRNGVLYFESDVINIEGNTLTVLNPIRHRFLQRRQFTRIRFIQDILFSSDESTHDVSTIDLSAGGMRVRTQENINIDAEYAFSLDLTEEQNINCTFQPIRIEKNDDGLYTLSGRFKGLSNVDRMSLVQFCIKKNKENQSK